MGNEFKNTPEQARKLWVEALRSGRYVQGKHNLRSDDGYCCLGVACDLYASIERGLLVERNDVTGAYEYDCRGGFMPDRVKDWLGLQNDSGTYSGGKLSLANDNGVPFAEIADIIESNPPGLFV
jgi:hypothetical protein